METYVFDRGRAVLLCTLNAACGEAIEAVQHELETYRLTAEVGFSAGHGLITRVWQVDTDEASLGLELALLNHNMYALKNGASLVAGCALGINPYGSDIYAVVLGKQPDSLRTALAQKLVRVAVQRAIAAQVD